MNTGFVPFGLPVVELYHPNGPWDSDVHGTLAIQMVYVPVAVDVGAYPQFTARDLKSKSAPCNVANLHGEIR